MVALTHVYPAADVLLRRFPINQHSQKMGLHYRITSLDQFSLAAGMFKQEEYRPALNGYPIATFVDLGCNAGWFALWLQANSPAPIQGLLVDANQKMVSEATWHITRNSLGGCVAVHGVVGVDPNERSAIFYLHPSTAASSAIPYMPGKQLPVKGSITKVVVPAISVASEWRRRFGDAPVDLLKIDIEGKELDFIRFEAEFLRTHVRRIVLEWHKWCVTLAELDNALAAIDFVRDREYGEWDYAGMATYQKLKGGLARG